MKAFGKKPDDFYFKELFRVSKNQIVWGANNFSFLFPCSGFIFWYKQNPMDNYSDGEMAYCSIGTTAKCCNYKYFGNINADKDGKIHPTQKPIYLYKWLIKNYAKECDKLLDTHSGSGSFRIAAYDMGFDLDSCELDKDYFEANEKRYQEHVKLDKMQMKLF